VSPAAPEWKACLDDADAKEELDGFLTAPDGRWDLQEVRLWDPLGGAARPMDG